MSNSPMVEQVNRLVGNLLAGSGEVALPGVGSLYVERQGAKRLSKRLVLPPSRMVSFTSQARGASLVEVIASAAQCDPTQAQEIYERWLSRTQEGDALTIEGVGILKFKNFTLSPGFDHVLNPQGHEPVRIRASRRFDWVLWFGVAVIVLVGAGGAALWLTDGSPLAGLWPVQESRVAVATTPVEPPVANDTAAGESVDEAVTMVPETAQPETPVAGEQPATAEPQPAAATAQPSDARVEIKSAGTPAVPAEFVSGRRYVVLGVFSAAENATRAIRDAVEKDPAMRCSVYRFGAKLMVTVFDAAETEPCAKFIGENSERFPGMWTYTAK